MIPALKSMPILRASGTISSKTAFICAKTNSPLTALTALTPFVFCAVRAVIALIAYIL